MDCLSDDIGVMVFLNCALLRKMRES